MDSAYSIPSTCTSCADSKLSQTASIVGILTFAYAILLGFLAYSRLIRKSAAESCKDIHEAMESLDSIYEEARLFVERVERGIPIWQLETGHQARDQERVQNAYHSLRRTIDELESMIAKFRSSCKDRSGRCPSTWAKFTLRKRAIDRGMAKAREELENVRWMMQDFSFRLQEQQAKRIDMLQRMLEGQNAHLERIEALLSGHSTKAATSQETLQGDGVDIQNNKDKSASPFSSRTMSDARVASGPGARDPIRELTYLRPVLRQSREEKEANSSSDEQQDV